MKKEADFEVSRVMPIYNLAIRAVSQLKPNDVTEIRGFKEASNPVKLVTESLIILFGMEKKMIFIGTGKDKKADVWETGKKHVLNAQLLTKCKEFKKDEI